VSRRAAIYYSFARFHRYFRDSIRGCRLASLDPTRRDDLETLVSELTRLLDGMQHGSVTLIVQDGRVVQLDATHKVRLVGGSEIRRPTRSR
jgi:hypothetical protein